MLNREQVYTLVIARELEGKIGAQRNLFFQLPIDVIREISTFGRDDTEFNKAIRHAASAQKEDIAIVVEMVKENPSLLLQAGNVLTRGGVTAKNKTLYEFFIAEGDLEAVNLIEPYFKKYLVVKTSESVNMKDIDRILNPWQGNLI